MKLSEAILKGCEGTKKQRGSRFDEDCCCALAAAHRGVFGFDPRVSWLTIATQLLGSFPCLTDELWVKIVKKNDKTKATREEIAVWLAEKGM